MQEAFIHFLWKLQYFDQRKLKTTCGQDIEVLQRGTHNMHAGPDFAYAKIKIGGIVWAGHVEIHVKSSDWVAHQHQKDTAYNNVILHVVWEHNDVSVKTSEGFSPPVLTLKSRVSDAVLNNYKNLLNTDQKIPCATSIQDVPSIYKEFMLEKTLAERLERKSEEVNAILLSNKNDWEETAYQVLMQAMGFKYNAVAFKKLACQLPFKILKLQEQLIQVEALLFGQAGLLSGVENQDAYFNRLKKEYAFLKRKYKLGKALSPNEWHFMRLRPVNFPTLRLAQLATVFFHHKKLMALFIETATSEKKQLFSSIKQAGYWQTHYHFGKPYPKPLPFLGMGSQQILMINVAAPLLVARANYLGSPDLFSSAVSMLNELKAEKNSITKQWGLLGMHPKTAHESQALIELYQQYCQPKKCLSCRIGAHIMKKEFELSIK